MFIVASILLTIIIYLVSKRIYIKTGKMVFSPIILCPVIIIAFLMFFHIPYESYAKGGNWLSYMLQPATVALAVPMYKYRATVKKYLFEIMISVTGGAIVAIVSSILIAQFLGVNSTFVTSLAPRSVTTPIAMSVSEIIGGNPSITAVFVICTGIIGAVLTSVILKYLPIKNPVTKGMLFGISAHGTGTSKAYEAGQVEGTIASLAMIFMGIITTVIAPEVVDLCVHILVK